MKPILINRADSHARVLTATDWFAQRDDAAAATMNLARELEQVSAQTFDVYKNPTLARQVMQFSNELAPGAETFSYDMYDGVTQCEWITNWGTPVGNSDAFKTRMTGIAYSFGGHYEYTFQDLEASSFANGRSLETERARMNRLGHEQFFDDLAFSGNTDRGIYGISNLLIGAGYTVQTFGTVGAPFVKPVVGTWDTGTSTTDLMKDLDGLLSVPEQNTAQRLVANRILLPLSVKPLMTQLFVSGAGLATGRTVESIWKENHPGVEILYWWRLNTASAIGGPRAIAYKVDPSVCRFVLAYDYKEMPPETSAFQYTINTIARVLGTVSVYPLGMAMMDLDASP
jgi:hypothetical protein